MIISNNNANKQMKQDRNIQSIQQLAIRSNLKGQHNNNKAPRKNIWRGRVLSECK